MKIHIFVLVFLALVFNVAASSKKMACPPSAEISPIKCVETQRKISITIDSRTQSQQEIEKTMEKIRSASKVSADESLEVFNYFFVSIGDSVRTVDLSALGKIKIQTLEFHGKFPKITNNCPKKGDTLNSEECDKNGRISVKDFNILNSTDCDESSLNAALASFDQPKLQRLQVKNPSFSGFPALLPKLAGLQTLIFEQCNITTIESGQFRGNPDLKFVGLHRCRLREIQKGAFDLGPQRNSTITKFYLYSNPIEESGISPNHGLAQLKGEIVLTLENTKITTLSEKTWKEYLNAERKHRIILRKNPLVCSPTMKWLKTDRKKLEKQIQDADCGNDEGKTVFDSNLV